jgi:single-stranded-DNA-specific exonuclease
MTHSIDELRPTARPVWIEPAHIPADADIGSLHDNPVVASILWRRGISSVEAAQRFIDPRVRLAPSPWELPNMEMAVDRVTRAIKRNERIAIFGDYDADGVTSAALLTRALQPHVGPDRILTLLPKRSDGYGVSKRGVDEAARFGAQLLITVDCGSSDHIAVAAARDRGLDVVILDHHRINGPSPDGAITVSPQLGTNDSYKDLTGVGVAWLMVSALAQNGVPISDPPADSERAFLDLVAIGTVADVSSLMGINRALVRDGLTELRTSARPGLRAMANVAERDMSTLTAADIAFMIAPRLNAAGRMGSPRLAYDLLMESDPARSERLALELERTNRQRKALAATIQQQAVDHILADPDWNTHPVLMASSPDWPAGMVGTIASKITEASGRPSILFEESADGTLKGSARSIPAVNIAETLVQLDQYLLRHGGHSGAAGLTLHGDHFAAFGDAIGSLASLQARDIPAMPKLTIDADLSPDDLSQTTVKSLDALEPCGRDNDIPLLRLSNTRLVDYTAMGSDRSHLKIRVRHGQREIECVCWNAADRSGELTPARNLDLVGTLGINTWRNTSRLQFDVKDFKADG